MANISHAGELACRDVPNQPVLRLMSYTPTFWKGVTMFTCCSVFTVLGFWTQQKLIDTYGSKLKARA